MKTFGKLIILFTVVIASLGFCSAHLFHISSIASNLSIEGNNINVQTSIELPYNLDDLETEEEKEQAIKQTKSYIQKNLYIANKGELCTIDKINIWPDEETMMATQIETNYRCSGTVASIKDIIIKSRLFQDVSSDSWTHFIFLNTATEKADTILTNTENIYPNTIETKKIAENWETGYDQQAREVQTSSNTHIQKGVISHSNNFFTIIKEFTYIGIEHIIFGTDHILFVVVLVLLMTSIKNILKITITFTLAHSITLILASLGVISLTGKIVEPIIALSIAYMSIENFLTLRKGSTKKKDRNLNTKLLITFIFGLFHGLGFAGALSEIQIPEKYFLTSLLSFNVGVELGQLFIVFIILLPFLYFLRKQKWKSIFLQVLSLLIACIGIFWFFERILS